MNRILSFLKRIKLPNLRGWAAGVRRLSGRQLIFWGAGLVLTVAVFLGVRGFTACWRLTALEGIPLASCGSGGGSALGPLQLNEQGTPLAVLPTPDIGSAGVQYPQWDGGSRINVAFFGLRGGALSGESCPLCTDTIIVASVDPTTKTAGMISVPRDLWVHLPEGYGHPEGDRINTAWTTGEASKYPNGGGPGFAMKTVSQFLGVPIQYYIQVDFDTFVELIKLIGGVDIYNDENLKLDRLGSGVQVKVTGSTFTGGHNISITFNGVGVETSPSPCRADANGGFSCSFEVPASKPGAHPVTASDGTQSASATFTVGGQEKNTAQAAQPAAGSQGSISLHPEHGMSANDKAILTCCGIRHLTGPVALAYARCRDESQGCPGGDVSRGARQQKLILAIRDKVFDPQNFGNLMARAPDLYNTFSSGIHTNIALPDALKLAALLSQVSPGQIRHGVIDEHTMTMPGNVTLAGQNAAIIMPIPDKIRELRDQIFTAGGPTTPIAQGDPKALMQADGARIDVVNNTYTANLDARTANYLQAQGMQVVALAPSTGVSDLTVVVVYSPKLYALRYLIQLGVISANNSHQIVFKPDSTSKVDLEVRLGNDWVSKVPAGN